MQNTPHQLNELSHMVDGDHELFLELKDCFAQDLENAQSTVANSLISLDWEALGRSFHTIKPNAQLFGVEVLRDLCYNLEKACQNQDEAFINEHIADFYCEVNNGKKYLATLESL